jgi:hypothetical protein
LVKLYEICQFSEGTLKIPILLLALILNGCFFEPVQHWQIYEFGRFQIHYGETSIASTHIEIAARRKERILRSYEELLDLTYDTIIPTFIIEGDIGTPAAWYNYKTGTITESMDYLFFDSGHEIAHAITMRMMGRPEQKAVTEGMAVFMELRRGERHSRFSDVHYIPDSKLTVDYLRDLFSNEESIRDQFSWQEYALTGVFLDFLYLQYGIEPLKKLWKAAVDYPDDALILQFKTIFNKPFDLYARDYLDFINGNSMELYL